ncbi:MAG: phenylpropionate dioxygenase-like ring-hydroxylating dioxygenase large terminal subunit [Parasphingorhabdus sp.]|jgi:phenylpropionate dioxygenase-like ring-hydroxylating dioxygenase large terminal subunit
MATQLDPVEFAEISKGYHKDPLSSWSMNARCYQDAKFLQLDQQQIFHRSWQFLCHESKLSEPGNYVTTTIQGQSVFAVRDKQGALKAFYNVCKHRGHELLSGEGTKQRIVCPYHAWSYNLDGSLKAARRSEFLNDFDVNNIRLEQIRVEIFCHLVFINLDPEAQPLSDQTEDLAREIMSFAPDLPNLKFAHRLTYNIKANWKSVVDNFLECYHCPVAHKDFCTLVDMDTYKVTTHDIYSSHMAKAGTTSNNAYDVENASVTDHAVWYLWPNTTLMRYPGRGNFMVWKFIPTGPETTYEEFDFYFETGQPNADELEAIKFIDDVLQPEDIGLVESVQRGMQSPAFNQGRFLVDPEGSGLSEHAVHHFHGLVLDAYRGACKL